MKFLWRIYLCIYQSSCSYLLRFDVPLPYTRNDYLLSLLAAMPAFIHLSPSFPSPPPSFSSYPSSYPYLHVFLYICLPTSLSCSIPSSSCLLLSLHLPLCPPVSLSFAPSLSLS